MTSGMEDMAGIPWHAAVALLVSYFVIYVVVFRGVRSSGKAVYVTATLPYILLTVLLVKGATLTGSVDGIIYYIKPDFSRLLKLQTWVEAAIQVFYSLGTAWGGLLTFASYSKFENNCLKDSLILPVICEGTSVFGGFAIFSVLGHMAYKVNSTVDQFARSGSGLAFVVYPEALSYLPLPQLWSVLFFIMLFTLGLDSQFCQAEVLLTSFSDLFPGIARRFRSVYTAIFMIILFLLSLVFTARGGIYIFTVVDWYIAAFTIMFVATMESVTIGWLYGVENFSADIKLMIGRSPPKMFSILWKFILPVLLTTLLIFTLATYTAPEYEGYTFPPWAICIGWVLALTSSLPIPIGAAVCILKGRGSLRQRLRASIQPGPRWYPAKMALRDEYRLRQKNGDQTWLA